MIIIDYLLCDYLYFCVQFETGGKRDKYSGGNPVNPQPTPEWQKSISKFFVMPSSSSSSSSSSTSTSGKENEDPVEEPCSSKDVDRFVCPQLF